MPIQQGIEGADGRFLRADGSIPLTANWLAGAWYVFTGAFQGQSGGTIALANALDTLRIRKNADEIMEVIGVSNNQANLYLKNLRIADLAGVGNRNVIADVNGDLSAP